MSNEDRSVAGLAEEVNAWCDKHGVTPANGQAGERMTERNVRYYRTLGILDAPRSGGGGHGYGERHFLQLVAVRLLQAQGLPLGRIRDLLFGRTLEELQELERRGLAELQARPDPIPSAGLFRPAASESWAVTPLNDEFLIVSRRGRALPAGLRAGLLALLEPTPPAARMAPAVDETPAKE